MPKVRNLTSSPGSRWESNIIVYVRESGCGNKDWILLSVGNLEVPCIIIIIIIIIPIVISSTGVIPKSLTHGLTRNNLHPNTYIQLQKSVILGTFSIVRSFLNYK